MMKLHAATAVILTSALLALPTTADVTIVDSVADLTWVDDGGASSGVSADTLTIQTSKNSSVQATLPSPITLAATGDYIDVTLTLVIDNLPVDGTSSIDLGFSDSNTLTSGGTHDYWYKVSLNPLASISQGVIFSEGDDPNLGKYNTDAVAATTSHTISFRITDIADAADMELTATSSRIAGSPRTVGIDITPATTKTLDTVFIDFRGNGFNETFPDDTIVATVTDFSVTTNVPEPGSLALALTGFACLLARRRH